jgi:hypothetical protein
MKRKREYIKDRINELEAGSKDRRLNGIHQLVKHAYDFNLLDKSVNREDVW